MFHLRQIANTAARLFHQHTTSVGSKVCPATRTFETEMCRKPTFRACEYLRDPSITQNLSLSKKLSQTFNTSPYTEGAENLVSAAQKMCSEMTKRDKHDQDHICTQQKEDIPEVSRLQKDTSQKKIFDLRQIANIGARLFHQHTTLEGSSFCPATRTFQRQMCRKPTFRACEYLRDPRITQNLSLAKKISPYAKDAGNFVRSQMTKRDMHDQEYMGSSESKVNQKNFMAKYQETGFLAKGGYGKIYEGFRKSDKLPVAIKHTPMLIARVTAIRLDNERKVMPMEVALMLKLQQETGTTSVSVNLLDWYEVSGDLIMVMERPVPCQNVFDIMKSRQGPVLEHEAKVIIKQVVDALIEIQSKGVFHRDIKPDNILLQTDSAVPRVRIIDFGCSTHLKKEAYTDEPGTFHYISPEFFTVGWYEAEPTTVWQLGVTAFIMVHCAMPFDSIPDIVEKTPVLDEELSSDCKSFLLSCLRKDMKARPTLQSLKNHAWLR